MEVVIGRTPSPFQRINNKPALEGRHQSTKFINAIKSVPYDTVDEEFSADV
jgi:hypothetical protein